MSSTDLKIVPGRVKFAARPSKDQTGAVDMVVDLDDGRVEKVFAPAGDGNLLAGYDRGDKILLVEAPNGHGGRGLFPAVDGTTASGRFGPLTAGELRGGAERMGQFTALLRDATRSLLKDPDDPDAAVRLSEDTARTIATTAFIQTFR